MNETQIAELLENFAALTKEVAENRRQINELLQEVGRLKAMQKPVFGGKSHAPLGCQSFNPYIKITRE